MVFIFFVGYNFIYKYYWNNFGCFGYNLCRKVDKFECFILILVVYDVGK